MEAFIAQLMEQAMAVQNNTSHSNQLQDDLADADEFTQMMALQRLCDQLNMATPLSSAIINPHTLVPLILQCLEKTHNPELVLLAARALTYMADSLPQTLVFLSLDKNADVLLQHLRDIQDIELSEQCLTCLEKLCQIPVGAAAVFRNGGVSAMLSFVDFFTISTQRKIWTAISRMSRYVTVTNFSMIKDVLPSIRLCASHENAQIRSKALSSLLRIVLGVNEDAQLVTKTFGDLAETLAETLAKLNHNESTFSIVLSLILATMNYSPTSTKHILESGLFQVLLDLLDLASLPLTSALNASPLNASLNGSSVNEDSLQTDSASLSRTQSTPAESTDQVKRASPLLRRHRFTFEQIHDLCAIFAACLLPCRTNHLACIDMLVHLEMQEDNKTSTFREEDHAEINYADIKQEGEEAEDNDQTLEQLNAQIEMREDIKLVPKPHQFNVFSISHICDVCNRTCSLGNWYRCNECGDYDLCAACLLEKYKDHKNGKHTFTPIQLPKPKVLSLTVGPELEKQKQEMYAESPALLVKVLRAVPSIVRLCTESEAAAVRVSGMQFLLSASSMASSEELLSCGFCDDTMCEAVHVALMDSSLTLNALALGLLRKFFEKLPERFGLMLVREGVFHALTVLKEKCGRADSPGGDATAAVPLEKKAQTLLGWKDILDDEASRLLLMFPCNEEADMRSQQLERIVTLLQRDRLEDAISIFAEALRAGVTPYELTSHAVVHEIRAAMMRSGDIGQIVRAACLLCEGSPVSSPGGARAGKTPAPFTLFIHHLQTMLARLDHFEQPSSGSLQSFHSRITLRLAPHQPASSPAVSDSAPLAKKKKSKRKEPNAHGETISTNDFADMFFAESSSGSGGGGGGAEGSATAGRSATVNIEPLATVGMVSSFIATQLLSSGSRRQRSNSDSRWFGANFENDDRVEEVLPELAKGGDGAVESLSASLSLAGGQRRKDTVATLPVWVRYENHILPWSMPMLQVSQQLVKPTAASTARQKIRSGSGNRHLPHEQRRSMDPFQPAPRGDSITLYYSVEPFGPGYAMFSTYDAIPECPTPTVHLPSQGTHSAAALAVLAWVHSTFRFSKPFLTEAQMDLLSLLGVFYELVTHWADLLALVRQEAAGADELSYLPTVSPVDFVHYKLDNKALRYCSNIMLAGQQAFTWAARLALDCNFLFSPSTRHYLFRVSFCGTVRSLFRMQQIQRSSVAADSTHGNQDQGLTVQLAREKKRVWRQHALECAIELLDRKERPSGGVVWEFEFYNENGSGLGPTREFYSLVSNALREKRLQLWMSSDENEEVLYYTPLNGLYPRLLPAADLQKDDPAVAASAQKLHKYFRFIGRFLARAVLDDHVATLPLSLSLIKLLRGDTCTLSDIRSINESVSSTLEAMVQANCWGSDSIFLRDQNKAYKVDSMNLVFTSPGDDEIELVRGGATRVLVAANMMEYCDKVTQLWLETGVAVVVKALREGFHDYIPLLALRMLTVEEIHDLFHGNVKAITRQEFEDNSLADHGFTLSCHHVQWLFDILASFNVEEQKRFFLFLTGSPHLPVGGLSSLRPKFTIVRKNSSEPSVREVDQLPSAMTCQHYLKLPAYESRQQMEKKLRLAIDEGTGAFLLT